MISLILRRPTERLAAKRKFLHHLLGDRRGAAQVLAA